MKRYHLFEAVGILAALFGAFVLVAALSPLINPGRHRLETGHSEEPSSYYLLAIPIPILILSAAWYFNRKAQRLRREEKETQDKRSAMR